jgi:hypothetical protein
VLGQVSSLALKFPGRRGEREKGSTSPSGWWIPCIEERVADALWRLSEKRKATVKVLLEGSRNGRKILERERVIADAVCTLDILPPGQSFRRRLTPRCHLPSDWRPEEAERPEAEPGVPETAGEEAAEDDAVETAGREPAEEAVEAAGGEAAEEAA